jgi:hypothetical protein
MDLKIAVTELKISVTGLGNRLTNIENYSNLQVNGFLPSSLLLSLFYQLFL